MPSTATSILDGLSTSVAVKAPVYAVTSASITLSGWQVIGGVDLEDLSDQGVTPRVLVKDQTNAEDNGIYIASSSAWQRAKDFDGNRDVVQGTLVLVRNDTVSGALYEVTSPNPIVVGTSDIEFTLRAGPNVRYDQTQAEIDAGVTPLDLGYAPGPVGGHILRHIPASEHAAILAGTSTYDASADAQRWLNSLQPGDIATVVGFVRAQGLLLKTSDIRFEGGGWLVPVSDTTATVLTIGDDSDDTLVRRISGHLRVGDITTNYTDYPDITGLKLVRCVEFTLDLDVTACGVGLDLAPSESAVAYNTFRLGLVYNNQIGIRFNPTGTAGYANENKFFGGRFSHGQALSGVGLVGIQFNQSGTFPPDNNVFYGPVFEHKGHSVEFNDGCTSNKILDARMEPLITSGTEGVDWESELVTFDTDAERNVFDMGMNTDPFTHANRNKDHGAATRVTDYSFTIASDLTKWLFPGQVLRVTVSGTAYTVIVHESSYSDPDTTVRIYSPVITANPTVTRTPRITSLSTHGNTIRWDRHTDGTSDDICSLNERHAHKHLYRSSLYIHGLGVNHPALTLSHTTGSDKALRVLDQNDAERAYVTANGDSKLRSLDINSLASITANGYAQVARLGVGGTPAAQQPANADTTGATLGELETEVNELKAVLRTFGLIAT